MSKDFLEKTRANWFVPYDEGFISKDDVSWLIKQAELLEECRLELHDIQELNRTNLKKIEELEAEIETLSMAHDMNQRIILELEKNRKRLLEK